MALSFQLSCGANQSYQYTEEDSWKRGWFNYTEECAPETSVCLYRPYEKLPEEMRSAVQILDDSRDHQYKMCGYYNTEEECWASCPRTLYCKSKQLSPRLSYNLVMDGFDRGEEQHQKYTNMTVDYTSGFICTSEKPTNTNLIVLGSVIGAILLIILGVFALCWYLSKRRQKQNFDADLKLAQINQHLRARSSRAPILPEAIQ